MNKPQSISSASKAAVFPILFGFFVMGFVDVVGIAANHVKADFGLSDTLSNLLPLMVFLWFALFSIPTGIGMGKIGRRNTVLVALSLTVVAMLLPLIRYDFAWTLGAFALLGIGNTMLQVSLNPMVAQVVRPEKMTSVLTWGQFIKAVSSFLGPVIAGVASSFWGDWKLILVVYAATSGIAALWLFGAVSGPEKKEEASASLSSTLSLFRDRRVLLLFVGILLIVGIDVGLNTTIPKLLMEKTGMPLNEAGLGTSLYFAARTAGAFAGAILLARFSAVRFLRYSMVFAIGCFLVLLASDTLWAMFGAILGVGLACANVFSILFSLALQQKPARANEISALMIMGVSGGAVITPLMGIVSDGWGPVAGLSLLLICMIYILLITCK